MIIEAKEPRNKLLIIIILQWSSQTLNCINYDNHNMFILEFTLLCLIYLLIIISIILFIPERKTHCL